MWQSKKRTKSITPAMVGNGTCEIFGCTSNLRLDLKQAISQIFSHFLRFYFRVTYYIFFSFSKFRLFRDMDLLIINSLKSVQAVMINDR